MLSTLNYSCWCVRVKDRGVSESVSSKDAELIKYDQKSVDQFGIQQDPKTPPKYATGKEEINMKRFVSNRCLTKIWQDFVSSSVFSNTMRLSKNISQHKTTWKSIKESQKCIQKFLNQQKGRISVSQPLWEIWRATLISYIDT